MENSNGIKESKNFYTLVIIIYVAYRNAMSEYSNAHIQFILGNKKELERERMRMGS